jgi:hypothetical protein
VLRQIIEEHQFSSELQDLVPNSRRADEFVEGTTWTLCRDPEQGTRVRPGSPVWGIPINAYAPGVQNVVIYYAFDADTVHLLSIQEVQDDE